jgi:hypothetical protein
MVSVQEFAGITRRVIARDGFDDYLPTALYPARKHIVVLEDCPEGVDLEPIAVTWATKNAVANEEFLVAFKVDRESFKVVRVSDGERDEATFHVSETE